MKSIKRANVNRAIELLQDRERTGGEDGEEVTFHKIVSQCKIVHCTKKKHRQKLTSFSKNLILGELKSHVARRDWIQARNLFPSLLRRSTDIEPLIWRYALIMTLYGNNDNLSGIYQFLKMCVGSQDTDISNILKNFLFLSADR